VAACLALPVELMSFTGKVVGKTHELSWTVFEEDLAAYAVQRRHAEATEWSLLTSVEATGLDQYAAVSIPDQPGEYLYRLGLREYDGTVTYSSLITLKSLPSSTVTLFPNPATGAVTVGQLAEGEKEISLLDGTGRVIFVKRTHEASLLLPTEALTAGLYFVVVKMDGEQEGLRLVLR
ncbi:MAG: T9SS type A sorting domain-containing protein, partial [Bacteroidota bacterium]